MKAWHRQMMAAGMVLVTANGIARAQAPAQPAQPAAQPARSGVGELPPGEIPGPIDNLREAQQTGRMLFSMADTNNDGQISQKEAIDVGNLMVGGFFFRADQNGDGILSQDEAKQARDAMFAQQPVLRYVIQKARYEANQGNAGNNNNNATDPAAAIGNLLDTNSDKQLQASEVRQAVQTAVQGAFGVADTNRDGQMSPTEINAAIIGAARTAAQAAFQQADADRDGSLSRDEFHKAIIEPADMVFAILDGNTDNKISQQESDSARRIIADQLRGLMVPEPPNSARNLLRTGASPDQVAPVPAPAAPRNPGQ